MCWESQQSTQYFLQLSRPAFCEAPLQPRLQWSFPTSWNAAVSLNYFQNLLYQDDFLAATNKAAMSCCLQILMLTTGIKSPPLGSLPNTSGMTGTAPTWGRGKAKKSLSSGTTAPASTQMGQHHVNRNVYPKSGAFPPCQSGSPRAVGAVPQEGPSWPREAHPVWQPRHFSATCLFTPRHTCWHTCWARGFEQVSRGKGPGAIWTRLPSWQAALQQELEESCTVSQG